MGGLSQFRGRRKRSVSFEFALFYEVAFHLKLDSSALRGWACWVFFVSLDLLHMKDRWCHDVRGNIFGSTCIHIKGGLSIIR